MYCPSKNILHLHVWNFGFQDINLRRIRVSRVSLKTPTPVDQFSASVSASVPNPAKPLVAVHNPLIVEHLIAEYGISRRRATSVSELLSRSTSLVTLSYVPNLFKQFGFSDTHIRNIIFKTPRLLVSKIDKTLEPKLKFLQEEIGFSSSSLADLIVTTPTILFCSKDNHLIPTINLLRSLLPSDEKLVKVLKKSSRLLVCGRTRVSSNVDFLRQYGLSDHLISQILCYCPMILTFKLGLLKDVVERVEKFGVKRDSSSFVYAVIAIASMSKSNFDEKFQLYKSYGMSESDIFYAFNKCPRFICLSEGKLRKVMSFLIEDLGYDPKDIASVPYVFNLSVEKRLKPRAKVMKILESKGLLPKKYSLRSIVTYSDKEFLEKFVVEFLDRAPELEECFEDL